MTKNLTLRQRNRLLQRSARERRTYAVDHLLVDDEGKTIEVCEGFFASVLRRASLRAEGKSARIFIVQDSAIYRVLFPRGDYTGWQFRKCDTVR